MKANDPGRGTRRNHALYGKPDFVFRAARVAVFVDGCFWHGCPIHATKPKNNAAFWRRKLAQEAGAGSWRRKLARNQERDLGGIPVSAQGGVAGGAGLGA